MADSRLNISNRRARYEFELIETYVAGMQLTGTEIKSIRAGKAAIAESFCLFQKGELFIKNMHIAEYKQGSYANHDPIRLRKLLLNRRELEKLHKGVDKKGLTIVPLKVFISENGFAKLEIALARGKKMHDKRESIKERDVKRQLDRNLG